jgi:hypothetical protein
VIQPRHNAKFQGLAGKACIKEGDFRTNLSRMADKYSEALLERLGRNLPRNPLKPLITPLNGSIAGPFKIFDFNLR